MCPLAPPGEGQALSQNGFLCVATVARLFVANGDYSDLMLRMMGVFMISLGIIAAQLIPYRAGFLYPTTLAVRTFILTALIAFYFLYRDPLLIVLALIVGIGLLLTGTSLLVDRKKCCPRAGRDQGESP